MTPLPRLFPARKPLSLSQLSAHAVPLEQYGSILHSNLDLYLERTAITAALAESGTQHGFRIDLHRGYASGLLADHEDVTRALLEAGIDITFMSIRGDWEPDPFIERVGAFIGSLTTPPLYLVVVLECQSEPSLDGYECLAVDGTQTGVVS